MNIHHAIHKVQDKIREGRIGDLERRAFCTNRIRRIKNKTPSVLASNCNGGVILHDLSLEFLTPTVNLWFEPGDFIKFLKRPEHYIKIPPIEIMSELPYPVGRIDDVKVYFQHYKSFQEACDKWIDRSKRLDFDNLFVMFTDRDGCTEADLKEFDRLPYKNKVVFTHKEWSELHSAYYVKGFEKDEQVGILSDWKQYGILRRRFFDDFDFVRFFNKGE